MVLASNAINTVVVLVAVNKHLSANRLEEEPIQAAGDDRSMPIKIFITEGQVHCRHALIGVKFCHYFFLPNKIPSYYL